MSTSFITTLHREGSDWVIKRNICRFSARLTKYTDTVHYRNFSDINICKRWQLHICLMFICFKSSWSVDNNTLCIFCVCTDSIVDTLYSVGRFHQVFVSECDYTWQWSVTRLKWFDWSSEWRRATTISDQMRNTGAETVPGGTIKLHYCVIICGAMSSGRLVCQAHCCCCCCCCCCCQC